MNPIRWKLHWQIAASLALAVTSAFVLRFQGAGAEPYAEALLSVCEFLGTLFMNALKMVIVPLIVASIIAGVMGLGSDKNFGRMGVKTLAYYGFSGLVAILIGLLAVNWLAPGKVSPEVAEAILAGSGDTSHLMERIEGRGSQELVEIFLRMFPPNIIEAATDNGQLLGLIVFSLLFGFFIHKLPAPLRLQQEHLWESISKVMMAITDLIIRFAPIGIFGLVTPIFMREGFDLLGPILSFFLTVLLALALHSCVALPLMLRYLAKINPVDHYRAMAPVILTAFSTASSASTLPLTLETVEKSSGVSNRTASFTLPLGATVNMDGTALYECVVVVFIAQIMGSLTGVSFDLMDQFLVVLLALLTSIGVAGIPSASLVAIAIILGVVGLPVEAIGIVWVTDRILDMCRTSVNVFSDTCGAVIIASSEGETLNYKSKNQ